MTLALFIMFCLGVCYIKGGTDFYTYFIAAHAFHNGIPAYLMDLPAFKVIADNLKITMYTAPYYYPPLTVQILYPLIFLPPKFAYLIWVALSVAAIILSVYLLTDKKHFLIGLILAFGFISSEITLYAGQVNAFLLLALSFAYYSMSRRKNMGVGLGIACGMMLKIVPFAHFGYLIWRGKIKAAMATVGFLIAIFVFGLWLVGWQGWLDFFHLMAIYSSPSTLKSISSNQALSGLIARFISDNVIAIRVWHISSALLIVATALICWPRGSFAKAFDLEFGLITVAIDLVMPYTWNHQNILLLIPLSLLVKHYQSKENTLFIGIFMGYCLANLHGIIWHYLSNPIFSSLPTVFALFLWAILSTKITAIKYFQPLAVSDVSILDKC